jgi:hypothetical protein
VFQTPILFLIFNRPDTTKQVFDSIKKVKPKKLYIAADGPRISQLGESDLCEQTRNIVRHIDWDCEINMLFRSENLGCKIAVSSAIDWFFDNEEQGIVLEDDCLPHQDFFMFCEEMLDYYKDDQQVMHIGGANFQKGKIRGDGSYYFSNYNHIWGWASWRRAWEKYDVNILSYSEIEAEKIVNERFNSKNEQEYWHKIFSNLKKGIIKTWDYQWTYSIWKNNGYSILPNVNLISNIGIGEIATHTNGKDILGLGNIKTKPLGRIVHPSKKEINTLADLFGFKHYFNPNKLYYAYRLLMSKINLNI